MYAIRSYYAAALSCKIPSQLAKFLRSGDMQFILKLLLLFLVATDSIFRIYKIMSKGSNFLWLQLHFAQFLKSYNFV